jgi:hypothetical protein
MLCVRRLIIANICCWNVAWSMIGEAVVVGSLLLELEVGVS